MKQIFWLVAVLIIFGVLSFFILVYIIYPRIEVEGFKNIETCESLSSGISERELIEKLGEPLAIHDRSDYKIIMFKAPSLNGAMIETKVSKNGVVEGIKCFEHGPWK